MTSENKYKKSARIIKQLNTSYKNGFEAGIKQVKKQIEAITYTDVRKTIIKALAHKIVKCERCDGDGCSICDGQGMWFAEIPVNESFSGKRAQWELVCMASKDILELINKTVNK
jgi:hypothetical protein